MGRPVALFDVRSRARIAAAALGACAAVLVASAAAGTAGRQGPGLVTQLQRGGLVLVLRHAVTDQSKQDEDPVDLADCSTQRNLSADGRAQARTIKSAVRRLKLPIGTVLTSRFCRTRETARLAFGRGKVEAALLNTINAAHDAAWREQMRAARRLIATPPPAGKLTVLVTHGVVVGDATGLTLEEGETLVFRPLGNGRYRLVGRIAPDEWSALRKPASSGYANLNTATFDRRGRLWFTGQSGIYGRLDPRTGELRVFRAPGGAGPYGITTTPRGQVWYASLAGSHVARIDVGTGRATVLRPPTPGQGARRIWSDSRGRLWVSEWNAGRVARCDPAARRWREWRLPGAAQPYAVYVDDRDVVWLTDFAASAIVRFDPAGRRERAAAARSSG